MTDQTPRCQGNPYPARCANRHLGHALYRPAVRVFAAPVRKACGSARAKFVMIGLLGDNGKPLLRAYSIASPSWDEELEFYSIKVPDGPLTSRLQHIQPGDPIILRPKPVGTLVIDALLPGKRLWMLATGTGIAPFASLLRDPETWEKFEQVIVMHTCREAAELTYGRTLVEALPNDPLIGELVADKLLYYPTTTREPSAQDGPHYPTIWPSGKVFGRSGHPARWTQALTAPWSAALWPSIWISRVL